MPESPDTAASTPVGPPAPPPDRREAEKMTILNLPLEGRWKGDSYKDIKYLHSSGLSLQKAWNQRQKEQLQTQSGTLAFRKYILEQNVSQFKARNKKEIEKDLLRVLIFLKVWGDAKFASVSESTRQAIKHKQPIAKSDRKAIHAGLFHETAGLTTAGINYVPKQYQVALKEQLTNLEQSIDKKNKKKRLIQLALTCLKGLKEEHEVGSAGVLESSFESSFEGSFEDSFEDSCEKNHQNVVDAINNFKSWPDWSLNVAGLVLGFCSAFTCSVLTGGSIYLLLAGLLVCLGPWGIAIAAIFAILTFLATLRSNHSLFVKAIRELLFKIASEGGITEFINEEGKRQQLSRSRKLFLVLAALLSFTVGISTIAFTVTVGAKILLFLIPGLLACPFALPIILGILGTLLGIGITILMFNACRDIAHIDFSKKMQGIQQFFARSRTISEWIGIAVSVVIKVIFIALVILGLYFSVFYGIPTLVAALSSLPKLIVEILGWISLAAQLPFTIISAINACNLIAKKITVCFCYFFLQHRDRSHQLTSAENVSVPLIASPESSHRNVLQSILDVLCIIWNAIGHGAPFVAGNTASPLAYVAAVSNVTMSVAANITEDGNDNTEIRARLNQNAIRTLNHYHRCISYTATTPLQQLGRRSTSMSNLSVASNSHALFTRQMSNNAVSELPAVPRSTSLIQ